MSSKASAVIVLPPYDLHSALNALRTEGEDQHLSTWMPHISLRNPFVDPSAVVKEAERLTKLLAEDPPAVCPASTAPAESRKGHGKRGTAGRTKPEPSKPLTAFTVRFERVTPLGLDTRTKAKPGRVYVALEPTSGADELAALMQWLKLVYREADPSGGVAGAGAGAGAGVGVRRRGKQLKGGTAGGGTGGAATGVPALPHLTVGQAPTPEAAVTLATRLNAAFTPIEWHVSQLDIVARRSADSKFRPVAAVPLPVPLPTTPPPTPK